MHAFYSLSGIAIASLFLNACITMSVLSVTFSVASLPLDAVLMYDDSLTFASQAALHSMVTAGSIRGRLLPGRLCSPFDSEPLVTCLYLYCSSK